MTLYYYGFGFVKLQAGERILAFNPIGDRAAGELKPPRFGADIVLVSVRDPAWNDVSRVSRGERRPLLVDGPGEYEIGGIFIKGFASPGPGEKINTVYLVAIDGLRLVHLGALASPDLTESLIEELGVIDLLLVPIDGQGLLGPRQAAQLVAALEPKAVVPINYRDDDALRKFEKEMGGDHIGKPFESFSFKKKDLTEKEGQMVVVKSF